ncbi:MAG: JmjC domain-containing protein [Candidatus Rokuibacteriota bacterium]
MAIWTESESISARVNRDPVRAPDLAPATSREGECALSPDFWTYFREQYWEAQGVVLRQALARPLVTAAEAFEGLVRAGDRYRAGGRAAPISFCIEHAVAQADVGAHLPAPTDDSVATYADRVTRQIQGQRFGLVAEDIQADDARLWLRLREFVKNLYPVTGWPGEKAKASVFLGNYRNTPFGVHRDRSAVFTFVVHGRKRILAWPRRFFEDKEDMTNRLGYERYRSEAIVLEGEPGDILYLPTGLWHIGEDAGGLSMTVTLTLFMEPRVSPSLLALVQQMVQGPVEAANQAAAEALGPGHRHPGLAGIARTAKRTARALRGVGRDPELERSLTAHWLAHVTGSGFTGVPDPLPPRSVPGDAVLRGDPDHPVMWMAAGADALICAANGHAFVLGKSRGLVRVLRRINSGAPCRVRDLIEQHSRAAGARVDTSGPVRALLEKLWSLRAIVVEG